MARKAAKGGNAAPGEVGGPPILVWLSPEDQRAFNEWFKSNGENYSEETLLNPNALAALLYHADWRRDQMSELVEKTFDTIGKYEEVFRLLDGERQRNVLAELRNEERLSKGREAEAREYFLAKKGRETRSKARGRKLEGLEALLRPVIERECAEGVSYSAKQLVGMLKAPKLTEGESDADAERALGFTGETLQREVSKLAGKIRLKIDSETLG